MSFVSFCLVKSLLSRVKLVVGDVILLPADGRGRGLGGGMQRWGRVRAGGVSGGKRRELSKLELRILIKARGGKFLNCKRKSSS